MTSPTGLRLIATFSAVWASVKARVDRLAAFSAVESAVIPTPTLYAMSNAVSIFAVSPNRATARGFVCTHVISPPVKLLSPSAASLMYGSSKLPMLIASSPAAFFMSCNEFSVVSHRAWNSAFMEPA